MGHTPYGYRIENGIAVVEPKEADAVVKMCKGYLRYYSFPKRES